MFFYSQASHVNKFSQQIINSDIGKIFVQIGGTTTVNEQYLNQVKDHLVATRLPILSNGSKVFTGNIFGLVYNQFR